MKLYNSVGPNPKVVRMFMAERGIDIECQEVDLMGAENRKEDYLKVNPAGQLPALELDNGDVISEITVICEYLDEKEGSSDLIGATAEARAETRMWVRRIDLGILENLANGFRYARARRSSRTGCGSSLMQLMISRLWRRKNFPGSMA